MPYGNRFAWSLVCGGAVCLGAALPATAGTVVEAEPNNTIGTAFNIDPYFSTGAHPNGWVENASTVPWVSVQSVLPNDTSIDYFSFTATAGSQLLLDVDMGMNDIDSWIELYNSGGGLLAANDDGGIIDPGTIHGFDSRLSIVLPLAGTYYVSVETFPNSGDQPPGSDYQLQVSLTDHAITAVPVPAAIWGGMALFGVLGGVKLHRSRQPLTT